MLSRVTKRIEASIDSRYQQNECEKNFKKKSAIAKIRWLCFRLPRLCALSRWKFFFFWMVLIDHLISKIAPDIQKHCNRIASPHSSVTSATYAPFPSSRATLNSCADSVQNYNFDRPLSPPKSNQWWLGQAHGSACCHGKFVQDNLMIQRQEDHT